MHKCAALPLSIEFCQPLFTESHYAICRCMNGPVFAEVCVFTRAIPETLLTNKNFAGSNSLPSVALYASIFRVTVSAVTG